jgi:hypothetical protein
MDPIVIFWIGILLGVFADRIILKTFKKYAGTLVVDRDEIGKIMYSLILEDDPQKLETEKEIIFKVVISEQSFNLK